MAHKLSAPSQWLDLYGDILYRYGLTRVRDPDVAEELVQETLLAALSARNSYAGKSSEQTWLIGILKHKMLDYFRKASKATAQFMDDQITAHADQDYFDQQGDWRIDHASWSRPFDAMESEQFLAVLHECLQRLPARMAQLFMLSELDGMKREEIRELMSISTLNNYWVMMSRARMQLRHCLKANWLDQ